MLPGPVAVILPDDLIVGRNCLKEMIDVYERAGAGHMVASMQVPAEETGKYGILSISEKVGKLMRADGIVEKPEPEKAPSNSAVVGRYILAAEIFDALATQKPGAGDEIQLTDAIARGVESLGLSGFGFSGTRFDCGSKPGMLRATFFLAGQDPECAEVLDEIRASVAPPERAA